jgi:serine/threonine protein kinase
VKAKELQICLWRSQTKEIDSAHSKGVIHGDIKPLNIIANSESKMLKIIDWGLGNFYLPGKDFSVHIGTRYHYLKLEIIQIARITTQLLLL